MTAALSVQTFAVLLLGGLAVTGWCGCADELSRRARDGYRGPWHARLAWAMAAVSGVLALACLALVGGCAP